MKAVLAYFRAGYNNLLKAFRHSPADIFKDIVGRNACLTAPDMGHNAVGAKVTAAFLHLDESTGASAVFVEAGGVYV